jgi:hypothetical protein
MADVGRPTLLTPETIQKLEEAFALGCTDLEACLYAGISKSTLYNYQEKNPKFVERKEELKETPVLLARTTVINSLKKNPDMAMKYLERKKKDEFSLRVENTGANGKDLIPQPIMGNLNVISDNNFNQEVTQTLEADTSSAGWDISQQDNLDTADNDTSGTD